MRADRLNAALAVLPLCSTVLTRLTNRGANVEHFRDESEMRGKTVVITGGTSGIGEVAAVILARMGARIVLVARDKIRGDRASRGFARARLALSHHTFC